MSLYLVSPPPPPASASPPPTRPPFSWRCFFGFHRWVESPKRGIESIFPGPGQHKDWKRTCTRCKKRQRWLPGYGGSELGCWLKDDP